MAPLPEQLSSKEPRGLETLVQQRRGRHRPHRVRTIAMEGPPGGAESGRFGAYLEASAWLKTKRRTIQGHPADFESPRRSRYRARELILKRRPKGLRHWASDPESGEPILSARSGSTAPYLQRGEWVRRTSSPNRLPAPRASSLKTSAWPSRRAARLPPALGEITPMAARSGQDWAASALNIVMDKGKRRKDYRSLKA